MWLSQRCMAACFLFHQVVPQPRSLYERGVLDDAEQHAVRADLPDLASLGVGHVGVAVLVGGDIVGECRFTCKSNRIGHKGLQVMDKI